MQENDNTTTGTISSIEDRKRSQKTQNKQKKPITPSEPVPIEASCPPIDYNVDQLQAFLDGVFKPIMEDEDNILVWDMAVSDKPKHGYPRSADSLLATLRRTRAPKRLYVSTALCSMSESPTGQPMLRNTASAFNALVMVVLDDIGTKVPADKIKLPPSYIIESSAGNFQYGYLLQTPIFDYQTASALIKAVYNSGLSDSGGAMPTKLVRLPDGYNGKLTEAGKFRVRLDTFNPEICYTPEELIEGFGLDLDWESVKNGAAPNFFKGKNVGYTAFKQDFSTYSPNGEDYIDPLMEKLAASGDLISPPVAGNDWATIICPWHETHTDDGTPQSHYAGYSPIGSGVGEFATRRAFHCFHDSCKDNKTPQFLEEMNDRYDTFFSQTNPVAEHLNNLIFVSDSFGAIVRPEVRDKYPLTMRSNTAIKLSGGKLELSARFPINIQNYAELRRNAKEAGYGVPSQLMIEHWMKDHNKITVQKQVIDPTKPYGHFIEDPLDGLLYNVAPNPPEHIRPDDYSPDDWRVKMYLDHINYLIPDETEREFFIDSMAMKAKDRSFRGVSFIMGTPTQGIGRGTLFKMLHRMMYGNSTAFSAENITYEQLVDQTENHRFIDKALVTIDEMADTSNSHIALCKQQYNTLKTLVSPDVTTATRKQKYATGVEVKLHMTLLIATQHLRDFFIPEDDRRFALITNPTTFRSPDYYAKLVKTFIDSDPVTWQAYVKEWFLQRAATLSQDRIYELHRAPDSKAKQRARGNSITHVDEATNIITAVLTRNGAYVLNRKLFKVIVEYVRLHATGFDATFTKADTAKLLTNLAKNGEFDTPDGKEIETRRSFKLGTLAYELLSDGKEHVRFTALRVHPDLPPETNPLDSLSHLLDNFEEILGEVVDEVVDLL
jgi:hypothetical protein